MEELQSNNYLVGIRCYTYNHAQYITDALNGFTMQQTTFPFIAMVVDDASTDGEQEVIAAYVEEHFDTKNSDVVYNKETEYAHISFAQHKLNKNCYIVVLYLKENLYSKKQNYKKREYLSEWIENIKYEALCEGDDYWTDPLKLQKQVDFLEANPEYSMCFGNIEIEDPKCEYRKQLSVDYIQCNSTLCKLDERQAFYAILTNKCRIQTLTVVFRRGIIDKIAPNEVSFLMGDTPMWLDLSQLGKIKYFNDVFGVYRVLGNSASHNVNHRARFVLSMYEMRVYYCYKYNFEIPNIVKHKYNVACADYMNSVDGAECQLLYSFFSINWFYDNFIMIIISSKWFLENKLGIRKGVMYINQVYRFLSSKLLKRNILKSI